MNTHNANKIAPTTVGNVASSHHSGIIFHVSSISRRSIVSDRQAAIKCLTNNNNPKN